MAQVGMIKILKKSDYGDYWFSEPHLDNDELKARTLSMLSKLEVSISTFDLDRQITKISREIYYHSKIMKNH